jgi:hypothetical protein
MLSNICCINTFSIEVPFGRKQNAALYDVDTSSSPDDGSLSHLARETNPSLNPKPLPRNRPGACCAGGTAMLVIGGFLADSGFQSCENTRAMIRVET